MIGESTDAVWFRDRQHAEILAAMVQRSHHRGDILIVADKRIAERFVRFQVIDVDGFPQGQTVAEHPFVAGLR